MYSGCGRWALVVEEAIRRTVSDLRLDVVSSVHTDRQLITVVKGIIPLAEG